MLWCRSFRIWVTMLIPCMGSVSWVFRTKKSGWRRSGKDGFSSFRRPQVRTRHARRGIGRASCQARPRGQMRAAFRHSLPPKKWRNGTAAALVTPEHKVRVSGSLRSSSPEELRQRCTPGWYLFFGVHRRRRRLAPCTRRNARNIQFRGRIAQQKNI